MKTRLRWNPLAAFVIGLALLWTVLAVESLWPLAVAAVGAVAWFAVPAVQDRRAAERHRRAALQDRAEQQHRWALLGDTRGTFGSSGAQAMRSFAPRSVELPQDTDETIDLACIAHTPAELTAMLAERKPGWHWMAFGSVLVQRRAAVQERLRDQQLCYAPPSGQHADTPAEAGQLALQWATEIAKLADQVEQVMLSSGLQDLFTKAFDEEHGDADAATRPAQRLMDIHDRFLQIAEAVRGLAIPLECRELFTDLGQLADVPLAGYARFIDDYVTRMAELPALLAIIQRRKLRGSVPTDPVLLSMDDSTELLERFFARLEPMLKG